MQPFESASTDLRIATLLSLLILRPIGILLGRTGEPASGDVCARGRPFPSSPPLFSFGVSLTSSHTFSFSLRAARLPAFGSVENPNAAAFVVSTSTGREIENRRTARASTGSRDFFSGVLAGVLLGLVRGLVSLDEPERGVDVVCAPVRLGMMSTRLSSLSELAAELVKGAAVVDDVAEEAEVEAGTGEGSLCMLSAGVSERSGCETSCKDGREVGMPYFDALAAMARSITEDAEWLALGETSSWDRLALKFDDLRRDCVDSCEEEDTDAEMLLPLLSADVDGEIVSNTRRGVEVREEMLLIEWLSRNIWLAKGGRVV